MSGEAADWSWPGSSGAGLLRGGNARSWSRWWPRSWGEPAVGDGDHDQGDEGSSQ
jgi:hypothetical protein